MSNDGRKHMRVAIGADLVPAFDDAKQKAEAVMRSQISDAQYAVILIKYALSQEAK